MKCPIRFALATALLVSTSAQAALVGYWRLDGDANAVTGVNGTLTNGPVAGADRNGAAGGALSFNGALSQFASIAGGGGLNAATQGTISMWVQWNGTQDGACCSTFGNVLARQSNGIFSNNIIGLSTSNPATANVTFQGYSAGAPILNAGGPVGNGYHHVAVSFAPGDQKLYLDGNLVATAAAPNASLNNNAGIPLTIGAWSGDGGGFSTSNIDDLAIFNTVLTATDIRAIAKQQGSPVNTIAGVTVTASSSLGGGFARNANNLIDGIELNTTDPDGAPFVNGDGGMWLSVGTGFGQGNDADPQLTFDLGTRRIIGGTVVYNYNEVNLTARGVDDFRILVSDDNFASDIRDLGLFSLDQASGNASNPGQIIDLGNVEARFVRFDIISNLRGTVFPGTLNNVDFNFVGLNEVQFFTGVVPEPASASLAMMGLLGLALRRRRR